MDLSVKRTWDSAVIQSRLPFHSLKMFWHFLPQLDQLSCWLQLNCVLNNHRAVKHSFNDIDFFVFDQYLEDTDTFRFKE